MVTVSVFVGVDTHADTHHAAVIDPLVAHLGEHGFPATRAGYRTLRQWAGSYGDIQTIGIEGIPLCQPWVWHQDRPDQCFEGGEQFP